MAPGKFLTIPVRELQAGDVLLDKGRTVYTIEKIGLAVGGTLQASVTWMDGGSDTRVWDPPDFDHEVTIARAES